MAQEVAPSFDCLEDADALDWLWLHERPWKVLGFSPVQAERQHSRAVFENLHAKRDKCHEALFGLGRLLLLDGKAEEALVLLEEAQKICRDPVYSAWTAWALLFSSRDLSFLQRPSVLQRCQDCCEEAKEEILALRCRAHLDAESAAAAAELEPVGGFAPYARQLLRGSKAQQQATVAACRNFLAEVTEDSSAAGALLEGFGLAPKPRERRKPARSAASAKLMVLDLLWRHLRKRPARAAEVAMLAAGSLRCDVVAWQRAVCLALKALALAGQWPECWRLAAAELSFCPSREVLYQCGRLAHYDGSHEAMAAYLPHLKGMQPLVPNSVQHFVGFWAAMLESPINPLVAAGRLRELLPQLEGNKKRLAAEALSKAGELEANVKRIYQVSNAIWLEALGKATSTLSWQDAKPEAKPPSQGIPKPVHHRPPGYRAPGPKAEAEALGTGQADVPWRAVCSVATRPRPSSLSLALQNAAGSAWSLFNNWRAAQAAAAAASDDFLGLLCKGRLHLLHGELEEADRRVPRKCRRFARAGFMGSRPDQKSGRSSRTWSRSDRLEALLELWCLYDAQQAHKKAVLSARKALELCQAPPDLSVDLDLILRHKVWRGSGGETLQCRPRVQLMLAKSLRRCGLWEDAWQVLLNASREVIASNAEASLQGAYGAFLYQCFKLCVLAAEDALRREAPLRWAASKAELCGFSVVVLTRRRRCRRTGAGKQPGTLG
ncbi:unnamed protein product, partial [Effrenium voratum]